MNQTLKSTTFSPYKANLPNSPLPHSTVLNVNNGTHPERLTDMGDVAITTPLIQRSVVSIRKQQILTFFNSSNCFYFRALISCLGFLLILISCVLFANVYHCKNSTQKNAQPCQAADLTSVIGIYITLSMLALSCCMYICSYCLTCGKR